MPADGPSSCISLTVNAARTDRDASVHTTGDRVKSRAAAATNINPAATPHEIVHEHQMPGRRRHPP